MGDRDTARRPLRYVLAATGLAALTFVLLYLLLMLAQVLLVVFAGVLTAVFLGGVSRRLSRRLPLSRRTTLAFIVLLLIGLAASIAALVGPQLSGQAAALIERLPKALDRLQQMLRENQWSTLLLQNTALTEIAPDLADVLGGVTNMFSVTLGVVTYGFIIAVVGIYGAAHPEAYVNSVVRLVPPARRPRAREVLHALGRALRWWLVGRFVMMGIVGVLTAVGLWIAGIPSPLALGFIAALLAFVPYIGPILSAVPALLVALPISLTKVIYVLIVYGVVQLMESYLITPQVQERTVFILPAALITAEVVMGVLAGVLGVLLATPLAVSVIVLVQMLYVEDVLGESVKKLGEHSPGA